MMGSICCIFNLAPHYNAAIYTLMDKELNCNFYIGDRVSYSIELMRYESLKGFRKILKFKSLIGNFYWQQGAVILAFKPYKHYLLTGDPHCISSWFILLLNRLTGRKTYVWTHGWYGNEYGIRKILKKIFFSLSDKVLLYGNYARNLMIEEGFKSQKLQIIYNSMDYDKQIKIQQKLKDTLVYKQHFKNPYPVLLFIGRIQKVKKIELLIEALNALQKKKSFYNLILIGEQTDKTSIDKLVSSYGLDKYVWFFGACYDENVLSELIYNSSLCVSPGNIGLTAMHCMVYGTPVLTHNNYANQGPEFEAIEKGITGDFFIENSIEDLCMKIQSWINLNNKQRETIRRNCYKVIQEKYNPNRQINVIKEALNLD
jgi:glycosyltransferase involved in cell wall biosynthesis